MDQPFYYRNKVQIPFQKVKNQVICGFFKKNSHEIFPMERCFIQPELATKIALFVGNLMNQYQIPAYDEERQSGCLRHVLIRSNSKNEFMLVLVTNTKELPHANQLIKSLQNEFPLIKTIIQNINNEKTNVVLGKKNLVHMGSGFLREELLGLTFAVSPHSFFQTNYEQTSKLYRQVLKYANPQLTDVIVDGYCGVGTIAVFLARFCKRVVGIEIVKEAVQDARANALLNNISNVEFIVGKTEEEIYKFSLGEINILIIDPPRKGCAPQLLQAIIEKQIPKIVYVSCNVATLARDLAFLSSNYEIKDVTFFDMFPQISDVEICVLLQIT